MSYAFSPCLSRLRALSGWRRGALAFALGLAAALAFPPFGVIPLLWLCFPALIVLLQGTQTKKQAFAVGWSFAFGQLVICLYWIAASMFVDIKSFWWAVPFAIGGLPAAFAIYYGLAAAAAHKWGVNRVDGVFFFALCWFVAEMARAHLFTGFPWDILGYVWSDSLRVLQSASLGGVEGLTLLTLLVVVTPALFTLPVPRVRAGGGAVLAGLLLFAGLAGYGQMRLSGASDAIVPDVRLRLVQPNIGQAMKWKPEQRMTNFLRLMGLSYTESGEKPITHVIWPETATPYYLTEEPDVRRRIAQAMPEGSVLLTGTVRRGGDPERAEYYNALIAMDSKGTVLAGYDKHHLVPFGEYMPYRDIVPFPVISTMGRDFSAGPGLRTVRAPNLPPFSGLVCYEAIFSGKVVERDDRPQFLLNVTNDAWYRGTIGPAQHFLIVRARAVEEGLPLVRVANSGITGVVDSYGRVRASIGADAEGFVDSDLPQALQEGPFFAKAGNVLVWGASLLLGFVLISLRFTKKLV